MEREIEIKRRFVPVEEKQLADPDYLGFFGEQPSNVVSWDELLLQSPLVILGEGRIGKTYEFKKQVSRLRKEKKFAFFIPLERLHDEDLEDALEIDDFELLTQWKGSPESEGYFFLDALDELKLREGTLRRALNKLSKVASSHHGPVSVIISCRPSDWKSTTDQDLKVLLSKSKIPLPKRTTKKLEIF